MYSIDSDTIGFRPHSVSYMFPSVTSILSQDHHRLMLYLGQLKKKENFLYFITLNNLLKTKDPTTKKT